MNKSLKMLVILAVLLLEFAWLMWPWISRQGYAQEGSYRHQQRFAAWAAWTRHPSPKTKAGFDREVRRLDQHMVRARWVMFAELSVLNGIGIYWFLKRETSKRVA